MKQEKFLYAKKEEVVFIDKIKNERKSELSVLDLNFIKGIEEYMVLRTDGVKVNVLRVEPINFNLKTKSEQNNILESYKTLLRQCNFDFQIYVQTQKVDVGKHISEIKKCIKYEEEVAEMAIDYIELIKNTLNSKSSISRSFYVIFEENESDSRSIQIEECLKSCGNIVNRCTKNEIIKLFKSCFKNNYSLRLHLKTRKEKTCNIYFKKVLNLI